MSLSGRLLRLSYRLDHHYGGALSVGRWIAVVALGIALIGALPKVHWPLPLVLAAGVIGLLTLALLIWGKAMHYYHFRPTRSSQAPAECAPIRGADHVKIRAAGHFSVEGRDNFFVDVEALYHSFETREHAVMAYVPFTRFLLGGSRPEYKGMWYIFWQPAQIISMQVGVFEHGESRPALLVAYRGEKKPESVCLVFENEGALRKAEADLWYDREAQASMSKEKG